MPDGQKLTVTWAPERVRGAVDRAQAIVAASDPNQVFELRGVHLPENGDAAEVVTFGRFSWMDLACLVDVGRLIVDDPEFDKPDTDGSWTIGPAPLYMRYRVLGEEDAETLLIQGHGIPEFAIAAVIRHAGFGRVLEPDMVLGAAVADGLTVTELRPFESWARERTDCPRHGWIPRWLRQWVWQRFEHRLEDCHMCTHMVHYRTCSGCGFCESDGSGRVPPCWEWITDGHKLFHMTAELEAIAARMAQIQATGAAEPGEVVIPAGDAKEFRALVGNSRAIRGQLEARGYEPVTIVDLGA